MKTGAELIADERRNQQSKWDDKHDDAHEWGELSQAAASIILSYDDPSSAQQMWPWEPERLENHRMNESRLTQLVVAGALVAAEIDKLLRDVYR